MKIIISQDGQQVFTVGENNLINIAPVEADEKQKNPPYSIGIGGVSIGVFKDKAKAVNVLNDVALFLSGREVRYTILADTK